MKAAIAAAGYDQPHSEIFHHKKILEMIGTGKGFDCVPIHVRIEPTEVCNFKCGFCWSQDDKRRATLPLLDFNGARRFALGRLLTLIDEFAELGTKAISFTGSGDPLIFPGLGRVLKGVRERGMCFGVTSNMAMRISDELISELVKAKWLRWSMNAGTPRTYLRVHNPKVGGPKAFEHVLENVQRINRARQKEKHMPDFNASYVVYTTNQHDILPAVRLASALEIDGISFRPDTPFEKIGSNEYSKEVKRNIRKAQEEFETERFGIYMNLGRLEDIQKIGDPELVCFLSNHTTYIAASGDVYPCCYTRYRSNYAMGNIQERDFEEFWFSDKRRQNYKKLIFDACPPCPYGRTNQVLKALYEGAKQAVEVYMPTVERTFFV